MSQDPSPLGDFSGTARLFPLPNLVLFPSVLQPLHIFEPRYRRLLADALAGDRLIAMALLRPGWEECYHKAPPVHPVVCIGRILQEERLTDGRYNLLLHGLCRARILEEVPAEKLYRTARVELLRDVAVAATEEQTLRRQLGRQVADWFGGQVQALAQMGKLLEGGLALGTLCDVFCFALALDPEVKQALLEELDVTRRVRHLLAHLGQLSPPASPAPARKFPPEFSNN